MVQDPGLVSGIGLHRVAGVAQHPKGVTPGAELALRQPNYRLRVGQAVAQRRDIQPGKARHHQGSPQRRPEAPRADQGLCLEHAARMARFGHLLRPDQPSAALCAGGLWRQGLDPGDAYKLGMQRAHGRRRLGELPRWRGAGHWRAGRWRCTSASGHDNGRQLGRHKPEADGQPTQHVVVLASQHRSAQQVGARHPREGHGQARRLASGGAGGWPAGTAAMGSGARRCDNCGVLASARCLT